MGTPLIIDYYSDVLCVWAWISQRRIDELRDHWGEQIELRYKFLNLFGNTENRMETMWAAKGGYAGFGEHVVEAASKYESAPVNPDIWKDVRPITSTNAHLVIKAAEICYSREVASALTARIQQAFFVDNKDIGRLDHALNIAEKADLVRSKLEKSIFDGQATAALMADYQSAQDNNIKGSPSWVMNEGRQILFGNVGYRILNANIEEILRSPAHEASWC